MNELDLFLTHLFSNIESEDITLSKKMKYGYRHYYLNVKVEEENQKDTNSNNTSGLHFVGSTDFAIVIDNRNKCIDVFSNMDNIVVEDTELVEKWTNIFEEYIQDNLEKTVGDLINNTFTNTNQKGLLRGYKLKKIDI
jgi:hypothetical protein